MIAIGQKDTTNADRFEAAGGAPRYRARAYFKATGRRQPHRPQRPSASWTYVSGPEKPRFVIEIDNSRPREHTTRARCT